MKRIFTIIFLSALGLSLSAQSKFTDPRDGNTYMTITAGGTTWMAENLKYNIKGEAVYGFDNNSDNIAAYGLLYDWKTALKACPDGWHLPSDSEFRSLIDQFEINDNKTKPDSGPATFKVQLAGMQDYEGTFTEMDESAYYWTSTDYNKDEAEYFSYLLINYKPVIDLSRKQDMPDIHG
ncbi:MAG: FISUMP domain-containing protein, partial [Bacteroidales bacterium]